MKKEFNIKAACKAFEDYERMKEQAEYFRRLQRDLAVNRYGKEIEAAENLAADFASAFAGAIQPLRDELDAVQARCHVRCITAVDIVRALRAIEAHLNISKTAMEGISLAVDLNAQVFPKAYKYSPESTIFTARYRKGWRIVDIFRGAPHTPGRRVVINHTDASRDAIVENYTSFAF